MDEHIVTTQGVIGATPICTACKSEAVLRDAWAIWNKLRGRWELQAVFDTCHCSKCDASTQIDWQADQEFRKKRIRRLNDALRKGDVQHGGLMITPGVQALGDEIVARIVSKVAEFEDFSEDNDPHNEHDFGAFDFESQKIFWKIDYFDRDLKWHSPDAANPEVTQRVLTVMLASEY